MAKSLGIGVRVYIGWTPPHERTNDHGSPCCRCGTITDGPYPPEAVLWEHGFLQYINSNKETMWGVQPDDRPSCWSVESLLTPIDDDGETVTDEQEAETHG